MEPRRRVMVNKVCPDLQEVSWLVRWLGAVSPPCILPPSFRTSRRHVFIILLSNSTAHGFSVFHGQYSRQKYLEHDERDRFWFEMVIMHRCRASHYAPSGTPFSIPHGNCCAVFEDFSLVCVVSVGLRPVEPLRSFWISGLPGLHLATCFSYALRTQEQAIKASLPFRYLYFNRKTTMPRRARL
jgi:hypothetical protein